jgi:hypothetical protein
MVWPEVEVILTLQDGTAPFGFEDCDVRPTPWGMWKFQTWERSDEVALAMWEDYWSDLVESAEGQR